MVCHPCKYQSIAENQPTGIDHKGCPFNTWKDDQRFCRRRWSFKTFCWFDFVDFGGLMVASALRKHLQHLQRNISIVLKERHLDQWILMAKRGASKIKSNQRCHYSNPASFAEAVSGSIIIEEAPIQGGSIPKQEIPNGHVELLDDFQIFFHGPRSVRFYSAFGFAALKNQALRPTHWELYIYSFLMLGIRLQKFSWHKSDTKRHHCEPIYFEHRTHWQLPKTRCLKRREKKP